MIKNRSYLLGTLAIGIVASAFIVNYFKIKNKNAQPTIRKPDVTLVGPIDMADGIGRQTAELAAVIMNDYKVQIVANHVSEMDLPIDVSKILKKKFHQLGSVIIFEESLWSPGAKIDRVLDTVDQDDQIRIAYSMLESTRIPQEWVMQLNLYFDAVVVPDPFLIEAYRESGVSIPIFEIPLGLDLNNFLSQPLKEKSHSPMVFANLSSNLDRKNQVLLIQAFAKALGNNIKAILKINCRTGDDETRKAIEDEIIKQNCFNIHFTQMKLNKIEYLKFFKNVDCYVSLSKGEGFSIQPREAMALGIPVIATDNTGQSTICKSGLVKIVNSEISEPAYYFKSKFNSGYRYNCSLDEAADAIKDMFLNYDQYLSKGQEARKWASTYSYSNNNISVLYKSLVGPKKVILGEENKITSEYLMTNSKELYDKYLKLIKDRQNEGTQLDKWKAKNKKKIK